MYFALQTACSNMDDVAFRCYLTPQLRKKWEQKLWKLKTAEEQNILEDIQLRKCYPVQIIKQKNPAKKIVVYCIKGKMRDYICDMSGKRLRGSKRSKRFTEYWKVIQTQGNWQLDHVYQVREYDVLKKRNRVRFNR